MTRRQVFHISLAFPIQSSPLVPEVISPINSSHNFFNQMTTPILSSESGPVCRWCEKAPSTILFDDALLCHPCHEKALLALEDPKLRWAYRQAVDYTAPLVKWVPTCKWCCAATSQVEFEGVRVCLDCEQKGVHALKNPKLCARCSEIFASSNMAESLFSEQGFVHSMAGDLRWACEEGCEMCRLMWLGDPNEEEGRLQFTTLDLLADVVEGAERPISTAGGVNSAGDINSLYFESEAGQFRMTMSVFALPGMLITHKL